jgi:hypothetical protein
VQLLINLGRSIAIEVLKFEIGIYLVVFEIGIWNLTKGGERRSI